MHSGDPHIWSESRAGRYAWHVNSEGTQPHRTFNVSRAFFTIYHQVSDTYVNPLVFRVKNTIIMISLTCYNIVVFGEPSVGKTCFIDQFCYGKSFVPYDLENDSLTHEIVVDGQATNLKLMDLSTSFLKAEQSMHPTEWAENILAEADGVVLLYDITNPSSLEYTIKQAYEFLWSCRRSKGVESGADEWKSFGCLLVGNKRDLVPTHIGNRKASQNIAEEWAQMQGIRSIEVDSLARAGPERALKLLMKHVWRLEKLGLMEVKSEQKHQAEAAEGQSSSIQSAFRGIFQSSAT